MLRVSTLKDMKILGSLEPKSATEAAKIAIMISSLFAFICLPLNTHSSIVTITFQAAEVFKRLRIRASLITSALDYATNCGQLRDNKIRKHDIENAYNNWPSMNLPPRLHVNAFNFVTRKSWATLNIDML